MFREKTINEQAFSLYARWEDGKDRENAMSLEELCGACPELLPDVRKIARQISNTACLLQSPNGSDDDSDAHPHLDFIPADWLVIDRGASSVVYQGFDSTFGATVAYKVLHIDDKILSGDDIVRLTKRFEQEAHILARLKHNGIVRIFRTFILGGRPVIEMEYLPNGNAVKYMDSVRESGSAAIAKFVEQIASAVGFAHEHGIVHRDLKPSNILLDRAGQPCVSDFGIAKLLQPDEFHDLDRKPRGEANAELAHLTNIGRQPGTRDYMAPEQLDSSLGAISPATDVWALGIILYELIKGNKPFDENVSHLSESAIYAKSQWGGRLEAIALRCLNPDPTRRYATATELAIALHSCIQRNRRRLKFVQMTGALSFVLLAGIASGKLKNPDPIPSTPVPIAFEESDSVRHAIADLGVGKPITLVEKNIDVTFRNIFGKETVKQIGTRSGYPSFHTKWTGPAAVELLPRLPRGKYRIEVELCHVSAGVSSQVAIFLGGQYWNSPQGQHMHCLSIIYDDASPNIVKQLDWQTDSRVEFATLLAGELYEKPSHWETREFGHFNFKKPDPDIKNTQLRRLKFEVRETSVLAWWDDHYLGTIDIDTYQTKLRRAKAGYPPPIDMGDTAEPLWDGRLGIIVCNGTVNIKEFSITPLP